MGPARNQRQKKKVKYIQLILFHRKVRLLKLPRGGILLLLSLLLLLSFCWWAAFCYLTCLIGTFYHLRSSDHRKRLLKPLIPVFFSYLLFNPMLLSDKCKHYSNWTELSFSVISQGKMSFNGINRSEISVNRFSCLPLILKAYKI